MDVKKAFMTMEEEELGKPDIPDLDFDCY